MQNIQETLNLKLTIKLSLWTLYETKKTTKPFSCANVAASNVETSRSAFKSLLFPTKMITMLGEAKLLASDNQLFNALKDSRLLELN